ncbi:MAG: multidrug DMT transporter [Planctomycetes bacterium GWF2_42_9]|nr:MAG: multidrug DMT transporter [Planctomycetes bacterium GWF2_42_9]
MLNPRLKPILQAILASIFFAVGIPASKMLLDKIEPVILASLLYLGSSIGLLFLKSITHLVKSNAQAGLSKSDLSWLTGAILAGGIAAPIVLMLSLRNTEAAIASLLLNFEGAATSILAAIMFREAICRRICTSVALITIASIILSLDVSGRFRFSFGAIGIIAACILWGFDNNFTRHISSKDPLIITMVKGFVAGIISMCIAIIAGNKLPRLEYVILAMVLGFFAYGLSIMFFIFAMRGLGSARTSAYFGTAPFIGALLSFIVFKEMPSIQFLCALPIMLGGIIFLLNEKHKHEHTHEEFEHDHKHDYDDDEHHKHDNNSILNGFHALRHKHVAITHLHDHTPDIHHRHEH